MVTAVGHVEAVSPVQWLAVDPAVRLWITRTRAGLRPELVDIIDAAGGYTGTFEFSGIPVAFLRPSRFVGLAVDETGSTTLSLFDLRSPD